MIRNFTSGQDVVDVSGLLDGYDLSWAGSAFSGSGSGPEVIVQRTNVGVLASLDLNGDGKADYAIRFDGITSLQKADFGIA